MFDFLKKNTSSQGSVYFRGNIPPRAEEFAFLSRHQIEVSPGPARPGSHWTLKLRHKNWGEADMICLRDLPPFDGRMVDYQKGLTEDERTAAKAAGPAVSLVVPATRKNVLRDRKNMLKFMAAAMGDDAVVAADHASQLFWSRGMLKDELTHDADLDVSALYCIHAVTRDEEGHPHAYWMHTHGLAELGAFDFDIVNPGEDFVASCGDFMRAAAFSILEGEIKPNTASFPIAHPGGAVRFVTAAEFDRSAPAAERALRDMPEEHTENRSVLCEPVGTGFLSRLFGGGKVRASRFCAESDLEGCVVAISKPATALMAQRAAATIKVFARLREQLAEFEFPCLVKMGYPTDSGMNEGQEHLWFEVHEVKDDGIDATLLNEPHDIAAMKAGQRQVHPISRLTDWSIMTPAGTITPSQLSTARVIIERKDEFRQMMAAMKALQDAENS